MDQGRQRVCSGLELGVFFTSYNNWPEAGQSGDRCKHDYELSGLTVEVCRHSQSLALCCRDVGRGPCDKKGSK